MLLIFVFFGTVAASNLVIGLSVGLGNEEFLTAAEIYSPLGMFFFFGITYASFFEERQRRNSHHEKLLLSLKSLASDGKDDLFWVDELLHFRPLVSAIPTRYLSFFPAFYKIQGLSSAFTHLAALHSLRTPIRSDLLLAICDCAKEDGSCFPQYLRHLRDLTSSVSPSAVCEVPLSWSAMQLLHYNDGPRGALFRKIAAFILFLDFSVLAFFPLAFRYIYRVPETTSM